MQERVCNARSHFPPPFPFSFSLFPFFLLFHFTFSPDEKTKKVKKSGKQKAKFMISIEGFCLSKCFFKVMSTSWRSLDFVNPRRKAKKNQKSQKNRREKKDNPPSNYTTITFFFLSFFSCFPFPFLSILFPRKKKTNEKK